MNPFPRPPFLLKVIKNKNESFVCVRVCVTMNVFPAVTELLATPTPSHFHNLHPPSFFPILSSPATVSKNVRQQKGNWILMDLLFVNRKKTQPLPLYSPSLSPVYQRWSTNTVMWSNNTKKQYIDQNWIVTWIYLICVCICLRFMKVAVSFSTIFKFPSCLEPSSGVS